MKKYTIIIPLVFIALSLCAQDKYYCVVSFVETGRTMEGLTEYLWIIPCDEIVDSNHNQRTISSTQIKMYPFIIGDDLYIDEYYRKPNNPPYHLDMKQFGVTKTPMVLLVRNRRKLVQTFDIRFSWIKGKIKVKVYITPIIGNIESTTFSENNRKVFFSNDFQYWESFYQDRYLLDIIKGQYYEQVLYYDGKNRIIY